MTSAIMSPVLNDKKNSDDKAGIIAGIIAYMIWGVFPVYFVLTRMVPATEMVAHRVLWSVPFGLLIILLRRQIPDVWAALKKPKTVALLALAAISLAVNWGIYIWAIQQDQIFQGSLGYYINPLIYVLVGVVFFKDKLSRLQGLSILMALIGVLILTAYGGVFPIISFLLAISFTCYGVIRKQVDIGAMPGLFIETILLIIPALTFMMWLSKTGQLQFSQLGTQTDILLMLAGPITVLPLLAFAFAARRMTLSTLGILQYIGPTLQFGCGLYFGETFTLAHALCFSFIWLGIFIYSYDALRKHRDSKLSMSKL